jgi:hypothetical protein
MHLGLLRCRGRNDFVVVLLFVASVRARRWAFRQHNKKPCDWDDGVRWIDIRAATCQDARNPSHPCREAKREAKSIAKTGLDDAFQTTVVQESIRCKKDDGRVSTIVDEGGS